MDDFEMRLTATLYRVNCPETHILGEYYLGLLSAEVKRSIQRHLAECVFCQQELTGIKTYLDDTLYELQTDRLAQVGEQMRIWVAEHLPKPPTGLFLAFGLRGESDQLLSYQAGDVQLTLEVQDAGGGRRVLLGLLLAAEIEGFVAHLWQNGIRLQSTTVDDLGNFVLPDLDPGEYDLIVTKAGTEIHFPALTIQ